MEKWICVAYFKRAIYCCHCFLRHLLFGSLRPDAVIDNYYQKGVEINKTLNEERDAMAPATQARNHAQTGIKPRAN